MKDKQPIRSDLFDQSSRLGQLATRVTEEHEVNGSELVKQVVMVGDKPTNDLLNRAGVEDRDERIRSIHAVGKIRTALGVWPERD